MNGIVNYAKEIAGVEVGILFQETGDGAIKVSLRSRPSGVNVSDIAQNFGGGGHPRAAGCLVQGSLTRYRKSGGCSRRPGRREKAGARDSNVLKPLDDFHDVVDFVRKIGDKTVGMAAPLIHRLQGYWSS